MLFIISLKTKNDFFVQFIRPKTQKVAVTIFVHVKRTVVKRTTANYQYLQLEKQIIYYIQAQASVFKVLFEVILEKLMREMNCPNKT